VIAVDRERLAGDERDAFLERHVEQRTRVDAARQRDPEVEPPSGSFQCTPVPANSRASARRPRSLLLRVHLAQAAEMRVDAAAPVELEHHALPRVPVDESIVCFAAAMRRTMSRGAITQPTRSPGRNVFENDPTDTTFARTAERVDRREIVAAVAQQPVRIIVDDDRAAARRERAERPRVCARRASPRSGSGSSGQRRTCAGGCPRAEHPRGGLHVEASSSMGTSSTRAP